jgi:hypothetical protein
MKFYFFTEKRRGVTLLAVTLTLLASASLRIALPPVRASDQKHDSSPSAAHVLRPTIAVLGVGDLDDAGHTKALNTNANSSVDLVTRAMAEEAITKSHAFRLYSRDLMTQQTKELKLNAEGWVDPASAQKFGKAVGIESFLTVFVASGSIKRFVAQNVSTTLVPADGEVAMGAISDPNAKGNGGGFLGKLNVAMQRSGNGTPRNLMQATATIMCRFTRVETGERVTESYTGVATADAARGDAHKVAIASIQDAFDNFRLSLAKNRTQIEANVTEIADNQAIVDMGEIDGIKPDMAFEVCELKKVGSFATYERICDARVVDVHKDTALLELGEYKKQFLHGESFSRKDDKAKLVHPGCIVREKKS